MLADRRLINYLCIFRIKLIRLLGLIIFRESFKWKKKVRLVKLNVYVVRVRYKKSIRAKLIHIRIKIKIQQELQEIRYIQLRRLIKVN
jgi:hypothetical protein